MSCLCYRDATPLKLYLKKQWNLKHSYHKLNLGFAANLSAISQRDLNLRSLWITVIASEKFCFGDMAFFRSSNTKHKNHCSLAPKKINSHYVVFIRYLKHDILNRNKRGKCVDVFVYPAVIFVTLVYPNLWSDKRLSQSLWKKVLDQEYENYMIKDSSTRASLETILRHKEKPLSVFPRSCKRTYLNCTAPYKLSCY